MESEVESQGLGYRELSFNEVVIQMNLGLLVSEGCCQLMIVQASRWFQLWMCQKQTNKSSVVWLAPVVALSGSFIQSLFSASLPDLSCRHFSRPGFKDWFEAVGVCLCVVKGTCTKAVTSQEIRVSYIDSLLTAPDVPGLP